MIGESKFGALPERVQDALGELAGAAKEVLLARSAGVGLGVRLDADLALFRGGCPNARPDPRPTIVSGH